MNSINESRHHHLKSVFSEVAQTWDLTQIYQAIEAVKTQSLSVLEMAIVRGLLSGYSPRHIAAICYEESEESIIIIVEQLCSYVDAIANFQQQPIQNYQDIPLKLALLGYKKTDNTILLNTIDRKVEEIFSSDRNNSSHHWQNSSSPSITENTFDQTFQDIELLLDESEIVSEKKEQKLKKDNFLSSNQEFISSPDNLDESTTAIVHTGDRSFPLVEENKSPVINRWIRWGSLLLMGMVGIALVVTAILPYKITRKASIKVIPSGEVKVVPAATTGTITEIKVRENQRVNSGDIIATIHNPQWAEQKKQLQTNIEQLQLKLKPIKGQIETLNQQILAENQRIKDSINQAETELNQSRQNEQNLEIANTAELETAQNDLKLAQEKLQEYQTKLDSAKANLTSQNLALQQAQSQYNRYQNLAASGALSQERLKETKLKVERQQQQIEFQQADINNYHNAIARQEQIITAAKARVENAEAALNSSNSELAIMQKKINQLRSNGDIILANLTSDRDSLGQQQLEIQKQLTNKKRELQQLETNLDRQYIKASTSGTIVQLNVSNFGQNVQPNTEVALITPGETSLLVKAFVSSQDMSHIKVGQQVNFQIPTCLDVKSMVQGQIIKVTSDVNQSQQPFYEITIKPQRKVISSENQQCSLRLGLQGKVDLISQEKNILEFLLTNSHLSL